MIQIASQPIQKSFLSHVISRSFFLSYFCYILVLIIPATILVNIQYSWPEYKDILVNPSLTYEAYQLTCLTGSGQVIYNSNLELGTQNKDYISFISVGTHNKKLRIQGQVFANNIKACSVQLYFMTKIASSYQVLTHLPINFAITSDTSFLISTTIKGTVSLKPSIGLSQSSILAVNQTQLGSYPFSFSSNFRESGNKSITLDSKILFNKQNVTTTSTTSFSFVAEYKILPTTYLAQASLIDKLRTFVPIFMYLCLFLWWIIVNPIIDWMLENKIYLARLMLDKIKRD